MTTRFKLPKGIVFPTIVADPPWAFEPENKKRYAMTHRVHYDRMSLKDICKIPVADVAHPDAILWLWTTNPAMEMALEVVKAWGFTYKTMATWRKSKMGTGWWLRSRTEHLILAARSTKLRTSPGSFTTELKGRWRGHSVKPVEAYKMIEALSPGPYLELFSHSKNERKNWMHLGHHQVSDEAYMQDHIAKLGTPNATDKTDGLVRGVGGLEIKAEEDYFYLEKAIIPRRVKVLKQTNRRVQILVPGKNGDEALKKSVSIDNLRGLDYTDVDHTTGRGRLVWVDGEKGIRSK